LDAPTGAAKVTRPTIWGADCEPSWIIAFVPSVKLLQATAWLARHGVESWFPTETVYVHDRRPPHKLVPKIKALIPGYMFAKVTRLPIRDFWISQSSGKISDIFHCGERLVVMRDEDLMQMRQVPDRLRDMREAAREAARIRPGDKVTITTGRMEGWEITVDSVADGVIRFTAPGGFPVKVAEERVTK
jgi:hypothetical protein